MQNKEPQDPIHTLRHAAHPFDSMKRDIPTQGVKYDWENIGRRALKTLAEVAGNARTDDPEYIPLGIKSLAQTRDGLAEEADAAQADLERIRIAFRSAGYDIPSDKLPNAVWKLITSHRAASRDLTQLSGGTLTPHAEAEVGQGEEVIELYDVPKDDFVNLIHNAEEDRKPVAQNQLQSAAQALILELTRNHLSVQELYDTFEEVAQDVAGEVRDVLQGHYDRFVWSVTSFQDLVQGMADEGYISLITGDLDRFWDWSVMITGKTREYKDRMAMQSGVLWGLIKPRVRNQMVKLENEARKRIAADIQALATVDLYDRQSSRRTLAQWLLADIGSSYRILGDQETYLRCREGLLKLLHEDDDIESVVRLVRDIGDRFTEDEYEDDV